MAMTVTGMATTMAMMATTMAGMAMAMAAMALMDLVLPGLVGAMAARAALGAALLQLLLGTLKCSSAYTLHYYMGVKNAGSNFESDVQASFIMVVSTGYLFI